MRQSPLRNLLIAGMSACVGVGCGGSSGPALGTVTGTVTMDGEPVPGVKIVFVPESKGSPSYGATDVYGRYRLLFNQNRAGAQLGSHHVILENVEPTTDDNGQPIGSTPIIKIPEKYAQPGVLSADVSKGRNKFDFTLEAESAQPNYRQAIDSTRDLLGSRTASK